MAGYISRINPETGEKTYCKAINKGDMFVSKATGQRFMVRNESHFFVELDIFKNDSITSFLCTVKQPYSTFRYAIRDGLLTLVNR